MALDDTKAAQREPIKESNDNTQAVAKMSAENQQAQAARDDQSQSNQRAADRAEMSKVTGSDFQIVDQKNGGQSC